MVARLPIFADADQIGADIFDEEAQLFRCDSSESSDRECQGRYSGAMISRGIVLGCLGGDELVSVSSSRTCHLSMEIADVEREPGS